MRIGLHTGPIVAGIVGVNKYAYEIWGDTVNIASSIEKSSEPGKVNISGSTYLLIRDKFKCTYRGKIEAKNKGNIDMPACLNGSRQVFCGRKDLRFFVCFSFYFVKNICYKVFPCKLLRLCFSFKFANKETGKNAF